LFTNIIGLGGTKAKEREKEQLDSLHQVLSSQSTLQIQKDFPRTSMLMTKNVWQGKGWKYGHIITFDLHQTRNGAIESWFEVKQNLHD